MGDLNIEPCDVSNMLKVSQTMPNFILDGIHFGRGTVYEDSLFSYKHKTTKLKQWKIVDNNLQEIDEKYINHFYDTETRIIQWTVVTKSRIHEKVSKSENQIYFYWKGDNAIKGYSPLPDDLEAENPPVERIVQWAEPPVFLQLFSGSLVVHSGKEENFNNQSHLYILRGEVEEETHLFEVPLNRKSLRSRTSFVVFIPKKDIVFIWHGSRANHRSRELIRIVTAKVFGNNFSETEEGEEDETLLNLFENKKDGRNLSKQSLNHTPRLFYLNSIMGTYLASEIENSHKSSYVTPFPFLQSHLYTATQPGLFILDDYDDIWLWHGWMDVDGNEIVYNMEKDASRETALNYAKARSTSLNITTCVKEVFAGFEPATFTYLFPIWRERGDIAELQRKQKTVCPWLLKDGKDIVEGDFVIATIQGSDVSLNR